ncbi:MAG: hypothetical protein SX243_24240 [Acidobacteriota bacterium]|nr:hypothetical protein [Acidobacteriota bacterium]
MTRIRRTLRRIQALPPGGHPLRLGVCALVGLLCWTLPLLSGGQERAQEPNLEAGLEASFHRWQPTPAEPQAVAEVLAETEVETAPDKPSWARYGLDVGSALAESLFSRMDRAIDFGGLPSLNFWLMAKIFLVLIGLLLAIWLGTYLYQRLSQPESPHRTAPSPVPRADAPAPREAGGWRRELEKILFAGDQAAGDQEASDLTPGELARALEALWWWIARSLAGSRADASWTSGDLLRHTGRRDLRGHLAILDTLRYGSDGPPLASARGELRELLQRFDQALGPQAGEARS